MNDRELAKNVARRLAIIRHAQEVSHSIAMTCRYYGISRECYYKWFNRFQQFGQDGLRDELSSLRALETGDQD